MTVAALSALVDTLFYRVIWKACYNWDGVTKEERTIKMNAALDEFKGLCMKAFEALMPEDAEEAEATEMEMKLYFAPVEEKQFSNRIAVKLSKETEELEKFLSVIKARIQKAIQTKEGRVFSDSNWTKLNDNTEKVGDAYASLRELLDSAKVEKVTPLSLLRQKFEAGVI